MKLVKRRNKKNYPLDQEELAKKKSKMSLVNRKKEMDDWLSHFRLSLSLTVVTLAHSGSEHLVIGA